MRSTNFISSYNNQNRFYLRKATSTPSQQKRYTKVMQVRGSKVKGHTLLKRNPKGRLHQDLSLVFQRCLSLGKLEHFGRHSSSFFGKKIFT